MTHIVIFLLLITCSTFSVAEEFRFKLSHEEIEAIKAVSLEKYKSDLSDRIIEDLAIYDLQTIGSLKCRDKYINAFCIKNVDRVQSNEIIVKYDLKCTKDISRKLDPKNKCYPLDNHMIQQSNATYPHFIQLLSTQRVFNQDF